MLSGAQRTKLPNGLTVLIKPDRRVPLACVLTWVKVGYFDEPDSMTGISHFIEHLFFKGTPKRGVGAIARETKALGGYLNAATIYDHTYYYTVVPAANAVQAIDIQSDALLNSVFDPEEIEKEKEVIVQELKRKYDNPDPYAWEKLLEAAFEKHRIRRWRMGREEEIRSWTRDAVLAHYRRYYTPENTIVVVAGDVDPAKILPEIEKRYASFPSGSEGRDLSPEEPPQRAPKISRLVGDLSQAIVKMGFHSPSVLHPDYHAVNALSILLGRGRSSRLYRALKEEKGIVDNVGVSSYASRGVGYLTLEAELKPESIAACEEELWVELDRLRRDPPSEQEVARIRGIVETNFFSEKEDLMGQAHGLAYFEDLGGYETASAYVDRMRSVTSADIVRVCETYCTFGNMSLLEYVPRRVGEGTPAGSRLESLRKRVLKRVEQGGPVASPPETPPAAPLVFSFEASAPAGRGMEAVDLGGGVTLLHLHERSLPLVSTAIYFPGGRLDETPENCGATQFVLRASLKGTETRTADEIAFEMESLGSSIQVEANADAFGYSMSLLSRDLEKGIDLLSDVILRPAFPGNEMEKERTAVLAMLQKSRDDMFRYPVELFYRALYGLHPYGLPRNGTAETVAGFSRDTLADWYGQMFNWKKMVVAVVGDVERGRAIDLVKGRFGVSGDKTEEARAQLFPVVPARGIREAAEERDRKQTGAVLGFSGVSQKDERFFALEVFRNVLAGMGGRLFTSLREKTPLAYTVTAFNIGLLRGGAFFTYIATSPENEMEARARLLAELEQLRDKPVTDDELRMAKNYSTGSHAMSLQGNLPVAHAYIHQLLSGRGLEAVAEHDARIGSVTKEAVRLAARDVIDPEQYALGVVRGRGTK